MPFCDSSAPNVEADWELRAACKNLKTSQFDVAPRIEDTSVKDESGRDDTYGARRGGSGGWEGMITPGFWGYLMPSASGNEASGLFCAFRCITWYFFGCVAVDWVRRYVKKKMSAAQASRDAKTWPLCDDTRIQYEFSGITSFVCWVDLTDEDFGCQLLPRLFLLVILRTIWKPLGIFVFKAEV